MATTTQEAAKSSLMDASLTSNSDGFPSSAPNSIDIPSRPAPTKSSEPNGVNPHEAQQTSTSPRHVARELSDPIPEESCETESELAEPVTPDIPSEPSTSTPKKNGAAPAQSKPQATATSSPSKPASNNDTPAPISRRSTFTRAVSSIFKRSGSQLSQQGSAIADSPGESGTPPAPTSNPYGQNASARRWSQNPSQTTTRSNSPPTSPGSPLEMATTNPNRMPEASDFQEQNKVRASTGLSFRGRNIKFAGRNGTPRTRRAASFDAGHHDKEPNVPETHWPHIPDAGAGTKARRISISLPDDFTVDVGDLMSDFSYQSKLLGRHGRHLGKGAASKVTLMVRKGFANELYAVKEFRPKAKSETTDEYEKKIKSEYSIAKSLHHPNIVETISLCTDHGRWNHVMEYCSEGDLYGLVKKRHLLPEDKLDDRLCLFKQLIQGIHYLHSHGIAHRDIKLENLLLTKDSKLKITDFGVSEVFCGTHPGLREAGGQCGINMDHDTRLCSPGICGSMPYIAPEVIEKKAKYDPRCLDVWGAAVVMCTMKWGGPAWNKAARGQGDPIYDNLANGWEQWEKSHEGATGEIPDDDYPFVEPFNRVSPPALRKMMLRMLHPDPAKRLTINNVYNHRWFRKIDCCQPDSYEEQGGNIDATKMGAGKKIRCHNHLPGKNLDTSLIGNSNFD